MAPAQYARAAHPKWWHGHVSASSPRPGAGPAAVGSPGVHEAAAGRVGAPACRDFRRPGHASGELRLRRRGRRHKQSSTPELPPPGNAATLPGAGRPEGRVREASPRLPSPPALPARTDGKYEPSVTSPILSFTQPPSSARHESAGHDPCFIGRYGHDFPDARQLGPLELPRVRMGNPPRLHALRGVSRHPRVESRQPGVLRPAAPNSAARSCIEACRDVSVPAASR